MKADYTAKKTITSALVNIFFLKKNVIALNQNFKTVGNIRFIWNAN